MYITCLFLCSIETHRNILLLKLLVNGCRSILCTSLGCHSNLQFFQPSRSSLLFHGYVFVLSRMCVLIPDTVSAQSLSYTERKIVKPLRH